MVTCLRYLSGLVREVHQTTQTRTQPRATMIELVLRIDVALFVLIGVLGGAHCIGMC